MKMTGGSVWIFLIATCSVLRANTFIEEAVRQTELEYADSEEEVLSVLFSYLFIMIIYFCSYFHPDK